MQPHTFQPEPAASEFVLRTLADSLQRLPATRELEQRLLAGAGVRLSDLVDLVGIPAGAESRAALEAVGFRALGAERRVDGHELFEHAGGLFPLFELGPDAKRRLFVRVESVIDFLEAAEIAEPLALEGGTGTLVRRALLARSAEAELWVVERRAERRLVASERALVEGPGDAALARHLEAFRLRPRPADDAEPGFSAALERIRAARNELGSATACELFFEAERRYYARKNRAARLLRAQQDALGFGFANRDHHTYRSSRPAFRSLVAALEALGLECRERFYAGADAGWGAQVMEHTETGICVFADVDLSPEEV
ncbi:MAG TPA: hypothetical protein VGK73_12600, partial [Polyangiaceae bacterium]